MIIYVTDINKFCSEKSFLQHIKLVSNYGISYIQVRIKNKDQENKQRITLEIKKAVSRNNTNLIINGDYKSCKKYSSYGFHITSDSSISGKVAKSLSGASWISKSIHSKEEMLLLNEDKEINAFVLGTIFNSNSHPNGATIGIENLKELVELSKKPVIGIGGINLSNIVSVVNAGAKGVAIISEIAHSDNLEKTIKKLKSYYD